MHLQQFIVILTFINYITCDDNLELKQIVILSRHNVRTPTSKSLLSWTPKTWPKWKEKRGQITEKGKMLEGFMGEYITSWLYDNNILTQKCPDKHDFFIFTSVKFRAVESAQAFIDKAFPNCNITLNIDDKLIFNGVIHNTSYNFKTEALKEMYDLFEKIKNNATFEFLQNVLDFESSKTCKEDLKCDLVTDHNSFDIIPGEKPKVSGPLKISNEVIDAFMIEYYEDLPEKDVAWGQVVLTEQWNKLRDLSEDYHTVVYEGSIIAKDISRPLLKLISELFLNNTTPKVSLLFGHDANVATIMKTMNFKPYEIRNQYQKYPMGGKIIFQKWLNKKKNKFLMKINYVYQSSTGMRKGTKLSSKNPPESIVLELLKCKTDKMGFCSWSDFEKVLYMLSVFT